MLSQEVTEPRDGQCLNFVISTAPLFRNQFTISPLFALRSFTIGYFVLSLTFELFFVSLRVWNNRLQTVLVLFVTGQFRRDNIVTKAQKMNLRDLPFGSQFSRAGFSSSRTKANKSKTLNTASSKETVVSIGRINDRIWAYFKLFIRM